MAIPVVRNGKSGNEARCAQDCDGDGARRQRTANGSRRTVIKQHWQAVVARSYMTHAGIREREGSRPCRICAQKGIVGTIGSPSAPRLPSRIRSQLFDKPLLWIGVSFNLSFLSFPDRRYQT